MSNPKRHHFIPVIYLKSFCANDGFVTVYRKDDPSVSHRCAPSNAGLERYYYAQVDEYGNIDTSTLEILFGRLESFWPKIVQELKAKRDVNGFREEILAFIGLQRARVPAARDAYELMRADSVLHLAKFMKEHGQLPPEPPGCEGLLDRVRVSVDPQSSLQAIPLVLKGFSELVLPRVGFRILHNETKIDFITSDNPVIWYVPHKKEQMIQPYESEPSLPLELIFPVSPKIIIYGSTELAAIYADQGFTIGSIHSVEEARRINRLIAKFAYSALYATDQSAEALSVKYANVSPVLITTPFRTEKGEMLICAQMVFGPRRLKNSWNTERGSI